MRRVDCNYMTSHYCTHLGGLLKLGGVPIDPKIWVILENVGYQVESIWINVGQILGFWMFLEGHFG